MVSAPVPFRARAQPAGPAAIRDETLLAGRAECVAGPCAVVRLQRRQPESLAAARRPALLALAPAAPSNRADRVAAGPCAHAFLLRAYGAAGCTVCYPPALLLLALERTQARPQRGASLLAGAALAAVDQADFPRPASPAADDSRAVAAQANLARTPAHTGPGTSLALWLPLLALLRLRNIDFPRPGAPVETGSMPASARQQFAQGLVIYFGALPLVLPAC